LTSDYDDLAWLKSVEIAPMTAGDLDEVLYVEQESFPSAWSRASYERDLANPNSHYYCARLQGKLVGYVGMWIILDEAHLTTIAVHSSCRRRGLGSYLVHLAIDLARRNRAKRMTLEVREKNIPAIELYRKLGFVRKGCLRRYYGDTGENGIVMWRILEVEMGDSC